MSNSAASAAEFPLWLWRQGPWQVTFTCQMSRISIRHPTQAFQEISSPTRHTINNHSSVISPQHLQCQFPPFLIQLGLCITHIILSTHSTHIHLIQNHTAVVWYLLLQLSLYLF